MLAVSVRQDRVALRELVLDPNHLGGGPWYRGIISSVGVLAWAVTVCGCAATAFVLHHGGRPRASWTFSVGAAFFALLMFDDLFQIHSGVGPSLTGLPKSAFVGLEASFGVVWLVSGRAELARTRWPLLTCALAMLALSLVADLLVGGGGDRLIIEDGAKFLGVTALAVWSTVSASDLIRSVVKSSTAQHREPAPSRRQPVK